MKKENCYFHTKTLGQRTRFNLLVVRLCGPQHLCATSTVQCWMDDRTHLDRPAYNVFSLSTDATKVTRKDHENYTETGVQRNVEDLQVGVAIIFRLVSDTAGLSTGFM